MKFWPPKKDAVKQRLRGLLQAYTDLATDIIYERSLQRSYTRYCVAVEEYTNEFEQQLEPANKEQTSKHSLRLLRHHINSLKQCHAAKGFEEGRLQLTVAKSIETVLNRVLAMQDYVFDLPVNPLYLIELRSRQSPDSMTRSLKLLEDKLDYEVKRANGQQKELDRTCYLRFMV